MDAKNIQLFVGAILWVFTFLSTEFVNGDEALINRLCGATSAPADCANCLHSDPSSTTASDIGLVQISMTCAANDMGKLYQDTYRFQGNSSDPAIKKALDDCLDQFEDAKTKINGVSDKVKRDFGTAKGIIDGILVQVNSCTNTLKSQGLQMPQVVSDDLGYVGRDWNIVVQISSVLS